MNMQRQTYDPAGNPEELDGMETFHPHGPSSASFMPDVVSRDTDRTLVEKKNRAAIGSAFGGEGREKVFSPPHSAYPLSANPSGTMHYGSDPTGTLGVHHPKEILRIERDWSGPAGGQVCQFYTSWVMELEGRITPTQFQALINTVNHHLQLAHSTGSTVWENVLAVLTWHTSLIWYTPRFERELRNIEKIIDKANTELWNSKGLNILSPRGVALQYLEIEYY